MNKFLSTVWRIVFLLLPFAAEAETSLQDTSYVLLRLQGTHADFKQWDKGEYLLHQLQTLLRKELHQKNLLLISETDTLQATLHPMQAIIYINILELTIQEPVLNQMSRSVSREITANNYSDETEDLRKQHAMVYADLVISEKSVSSLLRVSVSVIQMPEATTRWNELFAESFAWENRSATYTGSFEALGSKDIQLVRAKARPVPPSVDIYKTLIHQWLDKATRKLVQALQ